MGTRRKTKAMTAAAVLAVAALVAGFATDLPGSVSNVVTGPSDVAISRSGDGVVGPRSAKGSPLAVATEGAVPAVPEDAAASGRAAGSTDSSDGRLVPELLEGVLGLLPGGGGDSEPPPPPRNPRDGNSPLTKLRITIESTSEWATVDLYGGSFYASGEPSVSGGAAQVYSPTGVAIQRHLSPFPARTVLEVVYQLPADPLTLQVCKNNDGVTAVKVERVTGDRPVTAVDLRADRRDGVWEDDCANPVRAAVPLEKVADPGVWPRPVVDERLTLALYSPWYDEAMFRSQPFVDRPVGPYDTTDHDSIVAMIDTASGAGVNGFVYWYNGEPEARERHTMLVRAAEARPGFRLAPQLDLSQLPTPCGAHSSDTMAQWARVLLAHAESPSQLEVDGRPVLFVWDADCITPQAWKWVRSSLAGRGLHPFVVGDDPDPAYDFDGFWLLNANTVPDTPSLREWYDTWAATARFTPARQLGSDPILWAAGVSPGEDDTYSGKSPDIWLQVPREGGARYDAAWSAAAASRPEWVVISSWNDFHEATHVMPSVEHGRRALDQTRTWSARFAGS
jgi:hypothetical protein